jgi:hypothetical protein
MSFGILLFLGLLPLRLGLHQISRVRPLVFWACASVTVSFALANLFICLSEWRRGRGNRAALLRGFAVVFVLLPVLFARPIIHEYYLADQSGRTLARELSRASIPTERLAYISGSRAFKYSLNFYLHHEIKDWSGTEEAKTYVLAYTNGCGRREFEGFTCRPLAFDQQGTGWVLLLLSPKALPSTPGAGGQRR